MASQDSSPVDSQMVEGPWGGAGLAASEESIKLIPKIRPSTTPGLPDYVQYVGHKGLALSAPGAENARWDFDFVASPHTRQSSFFRVAGRPMADHFLAFYNAAIIAYGQTGSGKTHTMLGTVPSGRAAPGSSSGYERCEMPREAGLIPRVLDYIFQRIAAEGQCLPTAGSSNSNSNPQTSRPATAPDLAQPNQPSQPQPPSQPGQQQPPPPPASSTTCKTPPPPPEGSRPRWRSGIPTPAGVPRPSSDPSPYKPQEAASSPTQPGPPAVAAAPAELQAPAGMLPPAERPPGSAVRTPGGGAGGAAADPTPTQFLVKASMLQIYQEVVTDLLSPRPIRLQLRESMQGGVTVVGLTEVTVRSATEALKLLRVGTSHRAVAETASNPVSSRSHCILTLHMEAKDTKDTGVVRIRRSRLQLVDLAGSERTAKGLGGETASARQKEANAINKSLSTLCLVISRLSSRSQGPVPYRDSKLTYILQDCLGGNAKTLIIANLNPSPTCASETNMTLGFAIRAKRVRNRAVVNEDHQGDAIVLQGEVRRLREELSIFRTLHAEDGAVPRNIEQLSAWRDQAAARASELRHALELNGELEERLAAVEAAHARLRGEHAALEEQCEQQRCEMSALEATVEQCEAELLELRSRPTLEQYKALEEQLQTVTRERSDAQQQHLETAHQLAALQAEHEELLCSLNSLPDLASHLASHHHQQQQQKEEEQSRRGSCSRMKSPPAVSQSQAVSKQSPSSGPSSQISIISAASRGVRRGLEPARVRELHEAAVGLQERLREQSEDLLAELEEQGELRRAAELAFQEAQNALLLETRQRSAAAAGTAAAAVVVAASSAGGGDVAVREEPLCGGGRRGDTAAAAVASCSSASAGSRMRQSVESISRGEAAGGSDDGLAAGMPQEEVEEEEQEEAGGGGHEEALAELWGDRTSAAGDLRDPATEEEEEEGEEEEPRTAPGSPGSEAMRVIPGTPSTFGDSSVLSPGASGGCGGDGLFSGGCGGCCYYNASKTGSPVHLSQPCWQEAEDEDEVDVEEEEMLQGGAATE
ncbi:hypothetical protein Agub_g9970, partial [Astrephomene gubernaculifera]